VNHENSPRDAIIAAFAYSVALYWTIHMTFAAHLKGFSGVSHLLHKYPLCLRQKHAAGKKRV
jgi:hypothetical protein